jgi:hypothetical protein
VSVQGLPSGAYDLYVGGTNRGSLTVNSNAVTSGQVVFSTAPDGTNELLLTFAPTGQLIQLQQGTNVFFSGASSPAPAGCSVSALEVPLWNAGLIAGAQGKARYRTTDDCVQEFRVVVSGVPIGPYDLYGALAFLGSINVTTNSPANSGQIVISNPPAGFDPRGQLIEVRQGANLILSRTFPAN